MKTFAARFAGICALGDHRFVSGENVAYDENNDISCARHIADPDDGYSGTSIDPLAIPRSKERCGTCFVYKPCFCE